MPWASQKQEAFGNSPTGKAKMGKAVVEEFNQATKNRKLPVRKGPKMPTQESNIGYGGDAAGMVNLNQ